MKVWPQSTVLLLRYSIHNVTAKVWQHGRWGIGVTRGILLLFKRPTTKPTSRIEDKT